MPRLCGGLTLPLQEKKGDGGAMGEGKGDWEWEWKGRGVGHGRNGHMNGGL